MGRPRTCDCGECQKCKKRETQRRWYQGLSEEKRRALVSARDQEKVKANDRARYYRNRQARRARADAYAKANPEKVREGKKRWRELNPEKISAQAKARRAMLRGELVKEPCEICGTTKVHMHHDDYTKPLEVRWLCVEHHGVAHRKES